MPARRADARATTRPRTEPSCWRRLANAESVRSQPVLDLTPSDGCRDRKAGTRTRRIRANGRCPPSIAKIVDEEPPWPRFKRRRDDVAIRRSRRQTLGNAARIGVSAVPIHLPLDRHHHVQPLAAGRLRPALEPLRGKHVAEPEARLDHEPHSTPSPGSRSKTSVSGCSMSSTVAPHGWISTTPISTRPNNPARSSTHSRALST
jgi:hypothetical protein